MKQGFEMPSNKISEEEAVRSDMYQFLAGILQREPSNDLVSSYNQLKGDDTPIGKAFGVLANLAHKISAEDIRSEYHDLFIGVVTVTDIIIIIDLLLSVLLSLIISIFLLFVYHY